MSAHGECVLTPLTVAVRGFVITTGNRKSTCVGLGVDPDAGNTVACGSTLGDKTSPSASVSS